MGPLTLLTTLLSFIAFAQHCNAQIRGVNIGGWLVSEAWITPSLYSTLPSSLNADEWHLCGHLGSKKCYSTLHEHWQSWTTFQDFQNISNAGLNTVRIPIGYWAVDVLSYEPYVQGQFTFLALAVHWAKQLGLQVVIDLHGAPGSQNAEVRFLQACAALMCWLTCEFFLCRIIAVTGWLLTFRTIPRIPTGV
jgi:glucan 1,3-beta-glucosidase